MKIVATLRNQQYIFETKPGLFSKDKIDLGTRLLIENMEIKNGDTVVDLGCGYGPIGIVAANLAPEGRVYLVDIDIRALKYAKINAEINSTKNVEILASDGFEKIPPEINFDVVLSNPPSHMPKETIIEFIENSKMRLRENGKLYFVTVKRIKPLIKREFERVFGNYSSVASKYEHVISLANI